MLRKKFYIILSLVFLLAFTTKAIASLTFSVSGITSTNATTIDVGSGNTLSLQTVNNGAISTGTGTLTTGGNLVVGGNANITGTLTVSSCTGCGGGGGVWGSITGTLSDQTDLQTVLNGFELSSNKATDFSTVNDTLYPTVQAVKTYADGLVAGLLNYRGGYDASGNTYPTTGGSGVASAILKGDTFVISVVGTLGGDAIAVGDTIIANVDTPGQTAGNWNTLNTNISYVPEDQANKVTSISGASTDTQYPTAKLLFDQLALKQDLGGGTPDITYLQYFGDGSDGTLSISSGTTTLTRDMYYTDVTISGTASLVTAGYRVFISGTLDLTNAPAGAITGGTAVNGGNASGGTGGTAGTVSGVFVTTGNGTGASGQGTTATGVSKSSALLMSFGRSALCGAGGSNGGAQAGGTCSSTETVTPRGTFFLPTVMTGYMGVGMGGASGGSTTGGASGGGGGGGGTPPAVLISARTITRGGSTAAGAISGTGGTGGTGGTAVAGANRGGGGGGGGGSGGGALFIYETLSGSTATNAFSFTGGSGGNGGNGQNSGIGGAGGSSGDGGDVWILNITTATVTHTSPTAGIAGGAASGTTGGTGAGSPGNTVADL